MNAFEVDKLIVGVMATDGKSNSKIINFLSTELA